VGRIKLKLVSNTMIPSLRRITAALDKLPAEAHQVFKQETPIKTGNARKRTRLQGEVIKADYNYATELDAGKSRQAPEGMSKPTEQYITKRVKAIMRKK
jgi:hypothetical protein